MKSENRPIEKYTTEELAIALNGAYQKIMQGKDEIQIINTEIQKRCKKNVPSKTNATKDSTKS